MEVIVSRRPVKPVRKDLEYYELTESIRQSGQFTAILTRPWNGRSEIVDGHRRYRICNELGRTHIFSEREMTVLEVAVAKIQLNRLSFAEKREALFRLIDDFSFDTFDSIRYTLGEHSNRVATYLGFDDLAEETRQATEAGLIKLQVARLLCKLPIRRQRKLLTDAIELPVSIMVDKLALEIRRIWQGRLERRIARKNSADQPYLRSQKEIYDEVLTSTEAARLIALHGAETAYDGFQLALKWALKMDPESQTRRML